MTHTIEEIERLFDIWQMGNDEAAVDASNDVMEALPGLLEKVKRLEEALPELLAVKAERDRAQRACEQMSARIVLLEAALEEFVLACAPIARAFMVSDVAEGAEATVANDDGERFLRLYRRAALNQEAGS